MRLVDRVRIYVANIPDNLPVIVADPVAEQIDQIPGDTWANTPPADLYGVVAPPFSRFWIEAQTTVNVHDLGILGKRQYQVVQRGVLIEVEESDFVHAAVSSPGATKWRYVITPFIWYEPVEGVPWSGFDTVNGRIFLHVDENGRLLDDMLQVNTAVFDQTPLTADKMRSYVSFLPFVLKSLSVLHHKTVVERITHTRQQRRHHERKHNRLLADYYLLTVRPSIVATMADVGHPANSRAGRRAHEVRGHFRYYKPERPLFGRYSGMVWIADHSRGDPEEGQINKDYLIKP